MNLEPDVRNVILVLFRKVDELSQKKPYLSINEAAEYLSCKRQQIYILMERGDIAYSRPIDKGSGKTYFKREDLDAYLSRNYHPSKFNIEAQAANYLAAHP